MIETVCRFLYLNVIGKNESYKLSVNSFTMSDINVYVNGHMTAIIKKDELNQIDLNQNFEIPRIKSLKSFKSSSCEDVHWNNDKKIRFNDTECDDWENENDNVIFVEDEMSSDNDKTTFKKLLETPKRDVKLFKNPLRHYNKRQHISENEIDHLFMSTQERSTSVPSCNVSWNKDKDTSTTSLTYDWSCLDNTISTTPAPSNKFVTSIIDRNVKSFGTLGRARGKQKSSKKRVQRLAQYEQYFRALLAESRHESANNEEIARNKAKDKQTVRSGEQESDLDRIQDLFPWDVLHLHEKEALTMRMKGLIRKRSTTASKLQRALSAKRSSEPETQTLPRDDKEKRVFLLEAPVQFTTGVQSQERHLFLFNDLLLVAKARSGGNFKLKERVRVSEIWLSWTSIEDVIEVHKSQETSFVVGWPTTNVVATFSTQATRDLWFNKLNEVVSVEREKEPRSTNIQVLYYDTATNIEYVKTINVGPHDNATRCICLALEHLEMRGSDPTQFQLWAKTARDEAPYPLIGHERPFSIKLSCLRDGLSTEEGFDLEHCNNVHGPDPLTRCQFILRNTINQTEECPQEAKKDRKKNRKSPMRIRHVFRRSVSKGDDCVDHCPGSLFGQPLARVCDGDQLPRAVLNMLQQVFQKGPFTQGIFRKSANARLVRELRDKLDGGEELQFDVVPVLVTAALLKEFLRTLPESLLSSSLYPLWLDAISCPLEQDKLLRLKSLVEQLPKVNQNLLAHFLCVLHHVARRSSLNLMTPSNLGVCVGPSLLWTSCMTTTESKAVPALVDALVTHCDVIMGPHVPHLLGDPPERLQDSGAEESDSLHSGGLTRRDDSSIDSLEREILDPPRKDKISLSRDSGLTMSDSQLYTPDEEESTSSSSSGSGRGIYANTTSVHNSSYHAHNKVSASYSVPAACTPVLQTGLSSSALTNPNREYVRVYSGWDERVQECCRARSDSIYAPPIRCPGVMNPNFQRQDWFRQRSQVKRLNSGGSSGNTSDPQRAASQDSLFAKEECDALKRSIINGKGRAPLPPPKMATPLPRSKSAHMLCSSIRDTPKSILTRTNDSSSGLSSHMDAERSYDSSTLSDDDSTPHVSRSNSRGKDCTGAVEQVYSLCDERLVHAAPAQITSDPPPLPPKRAPLRHLPPVHLSDDQDENKPPERRGRNRRRDSSQKTSAHRSKSLPPPEEHPDGQSYRSRVQEVLRTNSDVNTESKPRPAPYRVDDTRTIESMLQAGQQSQRIVEIPPPYRPPPRVSRAPITSYHLGDTYSRRRLLTDRTDHQEESYV